MASANDFVIHVDGRRVTPGVKNNYAPGEHTVSVASAPMTYSASIGGACNSQGKVRLEASDNKNCDVLFAYAPQQAQATTAPPPAQEPAQPPSQQAEQKTRTTEQKTEKRTETKTVEKAKPGAPAAAESTTETTESSKTYTAGKAAPRTQAAKRSALEVKCDITQKDCYRPLGPIVFESYIEGRSSKEAPRLRGCDKTVSTKAYTLCNEEDSITLRLPRAPLEAGYHVRIVPRTGDAAVAEMLNSGKITVPQLRELGHSLDAVVNVQLYHQVDGGRIEICSSYDARIRAELCENALQPPAQPEQPAQPQVPPTTSITPLTPAPVTPMQPVQPQQPVPGQTQHQEQTVIVNPAPQQPTQQITPPSVQPPAQPPAQPPTVPPEKPEARAHPWLFTGKAGQDRLSTDVTLTQRNQFCNTPDCIVPLSQEFKATPSYGFGAQYNKPTLNVKLEGTDSNLKLKSMKLGSFGNAGMLMPISVRQQSVSGDIVKTFKRDWFVRPGVNAGGSYTKIKLGDANSTFGNRLREGYVGGAAAYGDQDKSHIAVTGGVSNQDVQVLYVAPTFNNMARPTANITPIYGQVAARKLLWNDRFDLFGHMRAYTGKDARYGASTIRIGDNQRYGAGVRYWINPQGRISIGPGIQYDGWRQSISAQNSGRRNLTDNAIYGSINIQIGGREATTQ